jgi:hypothetical protein
MSTRGFDSYRGSETGARLSGRLAEDAELTEVWKGGRLMGKGRESTCQTINLPKIGEITVHFFPILLLSPPVVFEHLSGRGLAAFLDRGHLRPPKGDGQEVRYVHGRSEVQRGTTRVSSVLLAEVPKQANLDEATWMFHLPEIYKTFLKVYDPA